MTSETSGDITGSRLIVRAVLRGALGGSMLAAAFIGGYLFRQQSYGAPDTSSEFGLLVEVDQLLLENFLGDIPDDTVRGYAAIRGLVASLNDPYTTFVEPQTAELDSNRLAGSFGGIGVEIARDALGRFVIGRVYRDNPAERAGVKEGDIIIGIDGSMVDESAADETEVLAAIRGDIGTTVVLKLLRGKDQIEVPIVRDEVEVPSVFWQSAQADQRVGVIQIISFTSRTPDEVRQAIAELRAQHAVSFVLDLRNNGGGLVDSALEVSGEFLDGGPVLLERGKNESVATHNAPSGGLALDDPLVVLVNGGTASASEIIAGALQDRGRALLVGQQTYGKGSVQTILPLSDGSSLRVTTAEWLTPDKNRLEGQGLTPDIFVAHSDKIDAELARAVEELVSQLLSRQRP